MQPDRAPMSNVRKMIADAVHAVCDAHLPDGGLGRCDLVAVVGAAACSWSTGWRYFPVVGGLHLLVDPPDGYFVMDCATSPIPHVEYHAWVVRIGPQTTVPCEWVDFSARHWRDLYDRAKFAESEEDLGEAVAITLADKPPIPWTVASPPAYFWHGGKTTPPGVKLTYSSEHTKRLRPDDPKGRAILHGLFAVLADELASRGLGRWTPDINPMISDPWVFLSPTTFSNRR